MTTPSSGAISFQDLATEFGDSSPYSLSEYYAGGGLVPAGTSGTNGSVPSSGAISMQSLYGISNIRYFARAFSIDTVHATYNAASVYASELSGTDLWTAGAYEPDYASPNRTVYVSKIATGNGSLTLQKYLTISGQSMISAGLMSLQCDSSGNLYSTINDFPVVLYKADSSLNIQWAYALPQIYASTNSFKLASSGNMYIGGSDSATITKAMIMKVASNLTVSWVRTFVTGSSPSYSVDNIAIDSSENVYAVGAGYNSSTGGSVVSFLIKYNTSGTLQWQRKLTMTSPNEITLSEIALASSGNVYVAGRAYNQTTNIGKIFVAKYNSSGTLQWQKYLSDASASGITLMLEGYIAVDSSENIYVASQYESTSGRYLILIKVDSSGNLLWQRNITTSSPYTPNPSASEMSISILGSDILLSFYMGAATGGASTPAAWTLKLPNDGSKTGTGVFSGTMASGNTVTLDYTAGSWTWGAGAVTDAAGAFTYTTVTPGTLTSKTVTATNTPYSTEIVRNTFTTIA